MNLQGKMSKDRGRDWEGRGSGAYFLKKQSETTFSHLTRAKSLINCSYTVIDFILNKTSNRLGGKQKKVRLAKETKSKFYFND